MKINKLCHHHEVPPPDRAQAIAFYAAKKRRWPKSCTPISGSSRLSGPCRRQRSSIRAVSPATEILGRHQPPVDVCGDPIAAAERKFAMIRGRPDWPFIDLWEGENELDTYNERVMIALAIFDQRMAYLMHQEGKRYAALAWSEGHPPPYWEDTAQYPWQRFLEIQGPVFLSADVLTTHEYWYLRIHQDGMWLFHWGRWPLWYDQLPPEMQKPVIIGECGVDGGVNKQNPGHGYDGVLSPELYMADLIAYNVFLVSRPEVKGATVFQWGTMTKRKWWTFDLEHGMIPLMMAYEGEEREMEKPIRVKVNGNLEIIPLETYLRGVVPAEVFPSWHEEALKANAVAARTYALWCQLHPQHGDADLCDGPCCQVYNRAKIHDRTDVAVRDTAGLFIKVVDGGVYLSQYIANCGLTHCTYCKGENGTRGEQWPGRMCQWGSQDLAGSRGEGMGVPEHPAILLRGLRVLGQWDPTANARAARLGSRE